MVFVAKHKGGFSMINFGKNEKNEENKNFHRKTNSMNTLKVVNLTENFIENNEKNSQIFKNFSLRSSRKAEDLFRKSEDFFKKNTGKKKPVILLDSQLFMNIKAIKPLQFGKKFEKNWKFEKNKPFIEKNWDFRDFREKNRPFSAFNSVFMEKKVKIHTKEKEYVEKRGFLPIKNHLNKMKTVNNEEIRRNSSGNIMNYLENMRNTEEIQRNLKKKLKEMLIFEEYRKKISMKKACFPKEKKQEKNQKISFFWKKEKNSNENLQKKNEHFKEDEKSALDPWMNRSDSFNDSL